MTTVASSRMGQLVSELRTLEERIRQGGGTKKIDRQHAQGKWTARERVELLIDPGGGRHGAERLVPARRQSGTAVPGALIGIAVTGGSSSGIKPALSLGIGTGLREETRIGKRVLARVPIADPAAFRDHPKRWRIEVTYLDVTGERRSVVLPVQ
jgi:hypothetical protein